MSRKLSRPFVNWTGTRFVGVRGAEAHELSTAGRRVASLDHAGWRWATRQPGLPVCVEPTCRRPTFPLKNLDGLPQGVREQYGISTFRLRKHVGLGACCRPGGVWVTRAYCEDALPTSIAILAQAQ